MSQIMGSVPRCDHCDWWWPFGSTGKGECRLFTLTKHQKVHEESKLKVTATQGGEAACETTADFGCVQWASESRRAFLVVCPIHRSECPLQVQDE